MTQPAPIRPRLDDRVPVMAALSPAARRPQPAGPSRGLAGISTDGPRQTLVASERPSIRFLAAHAGYGAFDTCGWLTMTLDGETATTLDALANAHDMLLETRRRDGSWVPTPVNPLVSGDRVLFRTWDTSGKAKRLRNFPDVRLAPSTARGTPTGSTLTGRARLLTGHSAVEAARRINRRYPLLQGVAVRLLHRLTRRRTQHYEITHLAAMTTAPGAP
jgi:PPOX class probable F420-dependent enzyme